MAKSVTELAKLRRHWYCILHSASSTHPLALPPWQDLSLNWVFYEAGPDVREVVVFVVPIRLSVVTWLLHDMMNSTVTHNVETISLFTSSGHVLMIVLLIHTPSSEMLKYLENSWTVPLIWMFFCYQLFLNLWSFEIFEDVKEIKQIDHVTVAKEPDTSMVYLEDPDTIFKSITNYIHAIPDKTTFLCVDHAKWGDWLIVRCV